MKVQIHHAITLPASTRANKNFPMKHLIIGTAGHVDHGKTSLIQALTNINTP